MKGKIYGLLLILLCLALALSLAACSRGGDGDDDEDGSGRGSRDEGQEDIPDPGESMEEAARALSGGDSGEIAVLGVDGEAEEGFSTSGYASLIMSRVTVDTGRVEQDGESAFTDAKISAPDMEQVLWDAIEGLTPEDDMEAALAQRLPELIDSAPLKEFEVRLELRYVDGQWCLVSSTELANAITGGLIDARAEVVRQALEGLEGGN